MATKLLALTCIRKERFSECYPVVQKHLNRSRGSGSSSKAVAGEIDEAISMAVFRVLGMTCSACAGSVEKAIKRIPGIHEAVIDTLNNRPRILFYPKIVNVDTIRETIEDAGFEASLIENEANERSIQVCRIRINGMTCTSCSSTIERVLKSVNGVQRAHVALAIEEAEIHYDPRLLNYDRLLEEIENAGFEAALISTCEDVSKIDLKIAGEFTDESMQIIERSLEALPGVQNVDINPGTDKISILYKPDVTVPRNFIRVIESIVFGHSGNIKATIFPREA